MWSIYLKKANSFLREAEIDIENECYLKAVSAAYFAIEHTLKALVIKEFGSFPLRIGALFSLVDKLFVRKIGSENDLRYFRNLMIMVREIYNHRKNVDHLEYIPNRQETENIFENAKSIVNLLQNLLM